MDETLEQCSQWSKLKDELQIAADRYNRAVRVLGKNTIDAAVRKDIQMEKALEEK